MAELNIDWANLNQAIAQSLLKDRFPLKRSLEQLKKLPQDSDSFAAQVEKIRARIQASQSIVQKRSAALNIQYPENLPVSAKKDDILRALQAHQVIVVAGETGSGKTTQLPKICLEAGLGRVGRIGHTQPRRLAARAVATRIAEEIGTELGNLVGYQVRFTDQSAEHSRIKLMTDGILLAQTQHDRFLNEYDCIIIDEAHERSLNIDFLLGYLKLLLPRRPDLKIIITSATIDVARFSKHFNDAPVIEVSGRTFPVEMRYRSLLRDEENAEDLSLFEGISTALAELREEDRKQGQHGDVLVFLPGEREIRECAEFLRKEQIPATEILPLYARLSGAEQQKIFHPQGGRRVVLATNVAETSLTVPGIRYVVDSGVARISRYSYKSKVQRLPIETISQASANQRAGRCGRTAPGICIRLYEENDFLNRPEFTEPEIQRTNLAAVILQMLNLKLGDISQFPFIDAPDERFIKDGFTLLTELEAITAKGELNAQGLRMAKLPVDPRISRLLLAASEREALTEVLIIAAALSAQDPRERPPEKQQQADERHRVWLHEESDFLTFVNLWQAVEEQRQELTQAQFRKWCSKQFLSFMRLREWRDTHHQLILMCKELGLSFNTQAAGYDAVHKSLLTGMLSHIGFKAEGQEYLGARNRKLMIFPASGQYKKKPKWIMAAELVETSKLYARTVARIEPQWLEELAKPLLKYQYFEPHFEAQRGQVLAFEQSSLYGLIINPKKRVDFARIEPDTARTLFIQEALVAQHLNPRHKLPFFTRNCALLTEVTEYEEKARRRDLVIDEKWQADFYAKHLPAVFISQKHLESWYEKASSAEKKALEFTKEQLLSAEASGIGAKDFPAELDWQGMAFPLSYSFAPGSKDDGVSLSVPVAMLAQVPDELVEWLVPGFITEKVETLLRGLPKSVRKLFVPVPNSAHDFLQKARWQEGSLYTQLLNYINQSARPKLEITALTEIELPAHLRMNIRLLQEGKIVAQGRNLQELKQEWGKVAQTQVQSLSAGQYQRSNIKTWDFGELPESVQSQIAGLPVRAFPCLKYQQGQIDLTIDANAARAQFWHRHALVHLAQQLLPEQERFIKSLITKTLAKDWLLTKGMDVGSQNELVSDLIFAVFQEVLLPFNEPLPRNQADMEQRLNKRAELAAFAEKLLSEFKQWLQLRHGILKAMNGAISLEKAMAFSDIKMHLERLMARGFLQQTPWLRLQAFTRYLKAMAYRLDKLQGNLARDRQSMLEFESIWLPYRNKLKNKELYEQGDWLELGWLLEEWRVALFAQPLGTSEPVSLKRLEKRWQELKDL